MFSLSQVTLQSSNQSLCLAVWLKEARINVAHTHMHILTLNHMAQGLGSQITAMTPCLSTV